METVQWWNCCGNTWRCEAMCIVRDVYSGLPVEVVQWMSLTFYPFLICFLSQSGRYILGSLNLVYEVPLLTLFMRSSFFSTLIPCQHQEEWPQYQLLIENVPHGVLYNMFLCRVSTLRQCYINLWRTWRSLSSRRCKTYTRWDKTRWEYWFSWY